MAVSVDGTPTDCVHLAITGLLEEEPDMVVAGINDGANLGDAAQEGKKICREISNMVFYTPASDFSVTASVGVASLSAKSYSHWKEILKDADRALYEAKANGKNCVKVANSN